MNITVMKRSILQKYLYSSNFNTKNTAVISFYGTGEKQVNFNVNPNVKYVKVNIDDLRWVDEPSTWQKEEFKLIVHMIKEWEAKGIIENIICECEAGVSRSAGCAAAISEYFNHNGINYFTNINYSPNVNVYNGIYKRLINEWKD